MQTIYLAGGCFWGMQKFFDQFTGVVSTQVGYANGPDDAPSYQDVCQNSGHAETVRIDYDETKLSLPELLDLYFMVIDPLSVNKQGGDEGIQYRTGVYYTDPDQLPALQAAFDGEAQKVGAPPVQGLNIQNQSMAATRTATTRFLTLPLIAEIP